jgi:hypothetical protein
MQVLKRLWGNGAFSTAFLVTAAVVITYMFGTCGQPTKKDPYFDQMKAWQARATEAEQNNDVLIKENTRLTQYSDSIGKVVAKRDGKINKLIASADSARKKNDSTLITLENTLPDTCKLALNLAKNYRGEADSLHKAVDSAKVSISELKSSTDSLKLSNKGLLTQNTNLLRIIADVPVYKEPKLLKIFPMPTRKTSFIVGGVVGVIATALIVNK